MSEPAAKKPLWQCDDCPDPDPETCAELGMCEPTGLEIPVNRGAGVARIKAYTGQEAA